MRITEVTQELRGRGLTVAGHTRRGDLAAALLDVAVDERAMMIVIDGEPADIGRVPAAAWDHVAHHAPCDVLIARSTARAQPDSAASQASETAEQSH